ncbi:MarR family transcriptional regulator [Gordonia sp. (in: high G+C Gram-positive bacteria)]|uniref:MarR family transcriptional regulator n=1 Tax=unclassified Gordonia (in: high G+C Gram-positive bacteria) TaxID=2657482 RepID=UPI0026125165|nr:MarR family transcriptional regulator [Gordonia sp. (in: high G+C Gram-positive bacteria)]
MPAEPPPDPDEVWSLLVHAVFDSRDAWRRAVVERTGLPFSRVRVLRRLDRGGPLSLKELAHAAAMDAPATTVAVNELAAAGLVSRDVDPADKRRRLVSLTAAGRAAVAVADATPDPAPPELAAFSGDDLRTLAGLLRRLAP